MSLTRVCVLTNKSVWCCSNLVCSRRGVKAEFGWMCHFAKLNFIRGVRYLTVVYLTLWDIMLRLLINCNMPDSCTGPALGTGIRNRYIWYFFLKRKRSFRWKFNNFIYFFVFQSYSANIRNLFKVDIFSFSFIFS